MSCSFECISNQRVTRGSFSCLGPRPHISHVGSDMGASLRDGAPPTIATFLIGSCIHSASRFRANGTTACRPVLNACYCPRRRPDTGTQADLYPADRDRGTRSAPMQASVHMVTRRC